MSLTAQQLAALMPDTSQQKAMSRNWKVLCTMLNLPCWWLVCNGSGAIETIFLLVQISPFISAVNSLKIEIFAAQIFSW